MAKKRGPTAIGYDECCQKCKTKLVAVRNTLRGGDLITYECPKDLNFKKGHNPQPQKPIEQWGE